MGKKGYYRIILVPILLFCWILFDPEPTFSKKLYRWVDKNGQVHITDYPPESEKEGTIQEVIEARDIKGKGKKITEKDLQPTMTDIMRELGRSLPLPPELSELGEKGGPRQMDRAGERREPDEEFALYMQLFEMWSTRMMTLVTGMAVFFYLYYALCLYLISRKVGVSTAWLAWIPVLNIFPLVGAAGKPWGWGILFLVPLLGSIPQVGTNLYLVIALLFIMILDIVLIIVLWVRICHNLWVNKWLGLLILVPLAHFFLMGYLAFKTEPEHQRIHRLRPAIITSVFFLVMLGGVYVAFEKYLIPHWRVKFEKEMSVLMEQTKQTGRAPYQSKTDTEESKLK